MEEKGKLIVAVHIDYHARFKHQKLVLPLPLAIPQQALQVESVKNCVDGEKEYWEHQAL